jgi:hypothetical protein
MNEAGGGSKMAQFPDNIPVAREIIDQRQVRSRLQAPPFEPSDRAPLSDIRPAEGAIRSLSVKLSG